jgi:peptidoglycan/LPS O-acetylase OafA/YrhL
MTLVNRALPDGPARPGGGSGHSAAAAGQPDLPATSGRNPALDGLRVLAASAVLLIHVGAQTGQEFTGTPVSWVISRAEIGVAIFFVLSGLLLYRPWAAAALTGQPRPRAGLYFLRRALRILPAYWVVVIVALVTLNHAHIRSLTSWLWYLLLAQNYDLHPWWQGEGANGLAQMWSLVIEVAFYLVLPLLAAALAWWAARAGPDPGRRARRLIGGLCLLALSSYGFLVLAFHPSLRLWLGLTLPHFMTWFAGGMVLAVLSEWAHAEQPPDGPAARLCRTVAASAGPCWLIAAAAFAIACTPLAGPETLTVPSLWNDEFMIALYTLIATAIVAPVALQPARPTWVRGLLGNRAVSYLGQISYGIFLWQFLVIYAFFNVFHLKDAFQGRFYSWPEALGILVIVAAVTTALAAISYHVLEQPIQRLYRLRRHPRRQQAAEPAAPRATATLARPRTTRGPARPAPADQAAPDQLGDDPRDDHQTDDLRPDVHERRDESAAVAAILEHDPGRPADRGGEQEQRHQPPPAQPAPPAPTVAVFQDQQE